MHSCPQCGDAVTKEQKFCSNCAWKVDSTIFDQEGIICTGQNDDGTACGRQLTNNAKFCPDCATPVKKADADVPVSDSNPSAADNPLTLQNVQNTIGSTDLEVEQHNNGIIHSAEQTIPNQNVSEDSQIKNSDVANGNSKEITSPSVSTPSDTVAAVKLVTGQKTPEPNAEDQRENPDSTPESQELITKSNSPSKEQNRETPISQEQIPDSDPFSHEQTGSKRDEVKMEVSSSQIPGSKNKTSHTQNTNDEPETPPKKLKLANESDSSRFQESSIKNRTVTIQPQSVFGPDKNQDKTIDSKATTDSQDLDRNQDKTTDSETTTDSQAGPNKNQDKTSTSETTTDSQAGPNKNQDKTSTSETTPDSQAGPNKNQAKTSASEAIKNSQTGPDKNQDKISASETTTVSQTGPDKNQDKTVDSEITTGPGSDRFKDSFIFGASSNPTNPSYFKGDSSSQKGDTKQYEGKEDGLKEKDKTDKESNAKIEKEGKQDEESTDDDSSDSKDSDSEKSDEDNKNLPASQKKKKDRKKNKKIKEEKKKERKKKKSSKKENPSNIQSDLGNNNASAKGPKSGSSKQRNSGKTSETTQGVSSVDKVGGRRHTSYSSIDVYFHVVIAPTLLENPNKDSIVIEFDKNSRVSEEWNKKQFKLKLDRSRSDEYIVGSVIVTIPKYLISESNGLFYNYNVDHGKGQDNCIYEYFHIAGRTVVENGYKRYLKIPIKDYSTGVYHNYDGVAREDPRIGKSKNLWSTVKDTVKKIVGFDDYYTALKDDAKRSVSLFHPKWQLNSLKSDGLNGEEMMCQVVNINEGLRSVYVQQMKLIDGTVFDGLFAKALIPQMKKIIHQLENMKKDKLDAEGKTLRLVTAVTVTHIVVTFEVSLEVKERRMLCEALLPCPDYDTKTSPDVEDLKTFLSTDLKKVADSVLKFSRGIAEKNADPSWLYCVPVIHFLLKKCKPFEDAPSKINHDDREPEWWGIVEYKNDIDHFKYKSKWDRPADEVVKKLTPFFEVDYLLPRTFLGSLNLDMLYSIITANSIPPDITLASTCYYIKSFSSNKELIKKLAKHVARKAIDENLDMSIPGLTSAYRTYRIAAHLLEESLKYHSLNEHLHLPAIEVFLKSSDAYDKIQNKLDLNKNELKQINISKDGHLRKLEDFKGRIVHWLSEDFHYKELDFLKRWNSALKMKIPEGKIKESYAKHLQERLQGMLENKGSDEKLIEIYCEHTESFDGTIQEILSKVALKAVNKCDSFDWRNQKDERCNMRLGKLLSSVFERSWDIRKLDDPYEVLHHAITWGPFPTYMEMYCSIRKALTEECQNLLKRFEEVIQSFITALIQGNISIKILRKLTSRSVSFQKILVAMKNEKSEAIMMTLNIRLRELEAFDNTYQIVQEFTYVCIHCKADTALLETKLKIFNAPEMVSLNKLVKTVLLENLKDPENYRPIVIVFELCPEELDILPKILECCKSLLFMKIWEKKGLEQQKQLGRNVGMNEVFEKVWQPALEQWKTLSKKLKTGDMFFTEFEKWFRTKDSSTLQKEFRLLDNEGDTSWIKERLYQIEQHGTIRNCVHGAKAIMEVVNAFDLKGDFSQIQEIIKLTGGEDTVMKKLDNNLLTTCSILGGINHDRSECLQVFIKCKPLVDWIKESMPAGLKELKVFVDLASISAGEGDMEIAKVNCLHSATTGYAPLIFNLEKECDTKMFLEKCEVVWKELVPNPQLPQKLLDTTRQLDWLQSVKKSHGSVEVTSLAQAEAINGKGIYQVGNLEKKTFLKIPELTDVLELRVPEEEGNMAQRNHYRYDQLHDLQSRLMLVAGKAEKGKDDVDRFMLILDSVVRLGNIYKKLVTEGCVLFSQWHVKFLCERDRKACAFINFGFGEERLTLKGRIDKENGDVSFIIPKLARFLEQCHEKWLDYIDQKREKYYCLNFFTIDQMVILQQELVKLGSAQEPAALIYPLLSAVKHGCTKDDLVKAMSAAKLDVDRADTERETEKEMEETDNKEEKVEVSDDLKTQTFFNEMTKSGYPLGLAREALKHVKADDIDGGIVWCMDNEDEYGSEEQSMSETAPDEVPDFHGWTQTDQSLASITEGLVIQLVGVGSRENSVDKLIKTLEDLWKTFLVSISSSVSDYLSVEHLGIILNRLNEQDDFTVNRTLLPCFTVGEPNLLICNQSDIYNTVLSVYSHEVDRPLPQSDEVLLCTPTTTLDMIEIFWRRALFANNDRVYCLVNADLLNYDVSDKGENSLERHLRKADSKGIKYRLVVICSSENEYRSRIVAALDKYHKPPLHTDVNMVRKYLLTKFKVDKSDKEWTPASTVDYERCSVRVVKSWRAGVGKSLYKKRMVENLVKQVSSTQNSITIPLHEKTLNNDEIMDVFREEILPPQKYRPRIFHIDISHEVQEGVDVFLFQLLILGCIGHSSGYVWRRSELDYYIIESMPLLARDTDVHVKEGRKLKCLHHCLDILPHIICRSPQESLDILRQPDDNTIHDRLFDNIEFRSKTFQRPYQYLKRLDTNNKLDSVNPSQAEGDKKDCLVVLLRHCGIKDPSWSELYHFVSFLNKQLQDFEVSAFCCLAASEDLPGFSKFVLRFLIQMSRDFSTRSLEVSEESPIQLLKRQISQSEGDEEGGDVVQQYKMRRTWETSPHPYLFFNPDHHSMTFLGFNIERASGNLVDQQTRKVLEAAIMQHTLFDALVRNRVNLSENFDALPRHEKINKLCNVMGLELPHDPDETYELTTDNVKKILAIYMRFRCDIPVIIMGETGCGKTRLIKFMCALQQPPGVKVENMILMKVHGGTKPSDIIRKVKKAEEIASKNSANYKNMDTVLFFDEANTTEAIGVIKEIMCDKSLGGKPINLHERLKIVAACNPYRKHSEKLIKRLEQAGLGYYVSSDKTTDKLGRIPMRHLVYRVQPLPQSMLPLVWDFGQLNTDVEQMYIKQMVVRYIKNGELPSGIETTLSKILTVSQDFMRDQKDECSFVSLRDVERVLQMMSWFYKQSREDQLLFRRLHNMNDAEDSDEDSEDEAMEVEAPHQHIDDVTRSLVLALGVCYHACLKNRIEYRDTVAKYFTQPLVLPGGADQIDEEISKCQSVFLDSVSLAPNIARNQALKENVFMMIVCIELRIPMFLVGKPGSSKSLAKTIVADAMQGNAAQNELFKNYKQVQMVSFQCSHLSVPEGIVGTFRQCANFQKGKPLDRFVSIVVLDEIGLAEDSPRMPLKTLHPLLEDGCPDDEEPEDYKKVAFIGISNWALDPAKMNRGILVQREVPDITELIESARGICTTKKQKVLKYIEPMIHSMADSYLALFKEASTEMREFFGLRDFYSLLKMLYGFVSESKRKPTWFQLKHSILRNFGGLENVKPVDIFCKKLAHLVDKNDKPRKNDPDCTPEGMIQACLTGEDTSISETRYLLLLTENYGALTILQQKIFTMENAVVIFGSSFPSDQEYTQVCRNINRIKVCMETGSTVILLNLENLYESLYDALNQYYVEFGGERYVDLGLGSHRVKCRVHRKFRLIVVAEKQIVYDKFPIPLINRLEKHFLSLKTMLTPSQLHLTVKLQEWAQQFCEVKVPMHMRHFRQKKESRRIGDAFMGYHDDTCAAIILYACLGRECNDQAIPETENEILKDAEGILLWCATPAAVLELEDDQIFDTYFTVQHHESLADYLRYKVANQQQKNIHAQITTNSKLLSIADIDILCRFLPILRKNIVLLNLQSFDTEQQFRRQIKSFLDQTTSDDMLLIIQCDSGDQNGDLIACARNTLQDELQQIHHREAHIHVVLLIQLPGIAGGCFTGFQCGLWHSVHIDDIHPAPEDIPSVAEMSGKSVSALLDVTKDRPEANMEIERDHEDRDIETMETNEEIDLMDIHIEEKAETKKQFKIDYLIKKCIQPALGNVKDPKSDETRAVDRLKIILNWMQVEGGQMTVLSGIAKHMTGILKEKEQNIGRQIRNWLTTEATKPENLNRAGTFRNFAVQCLEAKVIPVLAGIIAFIDTNRNLDILANSSAQDWQVSIWLQILNDPELTQLKYSLMVSPTRLQELQEITVKTTSVDGRVFSAKMPFSWIIFGQIEDVLRNYMETKEASDSDFDVVLKASDILQSLPMGRLLSGIEGTYIHQVLKAYIQDFVYMVHPAQSEAECNLICESLIVGCKHLLRGEFGRLLPSILGCHITFILHNTRFKNFSHIVHVWPECSQKTLEFQQSQSSFYLVTEDELTLDVLALHMLVDNLEPNRDDLNKIETRTKWLRQVCDYRPVVERIIGHFMQDAENREYHYGDRCQKGIENVRYQWTRVVVVKLFIEHVCTTDKDEISIKRCMPFWGTLREGADMKDLKSLEKVEKFIKHCNKDVVTQCFGKQTDCVSCETPIDGAPVRLPCSHVMCRKCFHGNIQLKEYDCPDCHKNFPEDLDPDKTDKELEMKKYYDYRRRCNSFFMEVVSQLCFADGTPPSKEVIDKLLSYITGQSKNKKTGRVLSKELTIFDDTIDPTPVVRSFLLQQLMQTSSDHEIQNHLSAYFTLANDVVKGSTDPHNTVELCLLVLQCMEDSLHQQYRGNEEVTIATQMLREAVPYIVCDSDVLDKIEHIARVRFSLTVVARHIHRLYGTSKKSMPDEKIRRMLEAAAKLCDECKSPWPRRYFVKQLCRCHGIDSYHTVIANSEASFLRWVCLPELQANEVKECHDRYIVIGEEYKQLREIIVTTILSENSEKLDTLLKIPQNEWQCRVKLYLALHREICMNKVTDRSPQKFSEEGIDFINQYILSENCQLVKDKDFAQRLLNNEVWKLKGNIIKGMELAQQNVFCLLTHYRILMSEIPGKTTLLTPLQKIALDPTSMVNSFFPTMPQDEIQEIKEALLAARDITPNENPVFYRCPNGHPYVIGDCGRPYYLGNCKECGLQIGGEGHVLTSDNIVDSGSDRTETGHILGRATNLGLITAPERQLNRASFAILRLLTHISMYIGANTNIQALGLLIKPNIEETDVGRYILEHIDLDMTSIQNILGKNKDDVLLLVHHLLSRMMEEHTMAVIGEEYPADMCGLVNKKSRSKWEEEFAKKYISPVLQNMDQVLKQSNEKIQKDQRLGADALLQILYETDKVPENQDILKLQDIPGVWRYRDLISINHLRQNLERSQEKLPVLRLFLKEEHHLRAIRFIPSIMRLQRMLIQKYGRKLDRAEATTLKIQDVKQDMEKDRKIDEFEQLLKDFTEAWICVKESLKTTVCLLENNVLSIDKSYFRAAISDDTPISYLIPTYRDAGLCSYILLYFLLKKQNMFIEQYCYQRKLSAESLPKVHVKDISSAHLISYHPDKDLLPMVLANCNYTFEVGQGTRIEYNFTNLERQLMDRFLFSKSIITGIAEIETITYRSESTNAVVFKTLCDKVQQERLNPAVRSQICAEIRMKPAADLWESLDKLDIAISFLKSVGSDSDSSLSDFITNTLKIDNPFSSPKAQQSSRCKHTMSLWMTLALERAKEIAKNNRKAFEGISENFKKNLTEEQRKAIVEIINSLPIEQIDTLVEVIFECIVFKVDVPQDDEEEELFSKVSFHDTLIGYMDTCPYEEDKQLDETLKEVIDLIPSDDQFSIVTCQSVEFWHLVQKIHMDKQKRKH